MIEAFLRVMLAAAARIKAAPTNFGTPARKRRSRAKNWKLTRSHAFRGLKQSKFRVVEFTPPAEQRKGNFRSRVLGPNYADA